MINETPSPRNENDNYFLTLLAIATIVIVLLCFKLFSLGNKYEHEANMSSALLTDIAALEDKVRSNKHIVDTLYVQKVSIQTKYRDRIRLISQLDSVQHDSLFGLIYPSKDSANKTFYHYNHASEQLALSDSIITIKDSIIVDLTTISFKKDTIIAIKDKVIDSKDKQIASQKKITKRAYVIGGAVGFIIGLLIP